MQEGFKSMNVRIDNVQQDLDGVKQDVKKLSDDTENFKKDVKQDLKKLSDDSEKIKMDLDGVQKNQSVTSTILGSMYESHFRRMMSEEKNSQYKNPKEFMDLVNDALINHNKGLVPKDNNYGVDLINAFDQAVLKFKKAGKYERLLYDWLKEKKEVGISVDKCKYPYSTHKYIFKDNHKKIKSLESDIDFIKVHLIDKTYIFTITEIKTTMRPYAYFQVLRHGFILSYLLKRTKFEPPHQIRLLVHSIVPPELLSLDQFFKTTYQPESTNTGESKPTPILSKKHFPQDLDIVFGNFPFLISFATVENSKDKDFLTRKSKTVVDINQYMTKLNQL